MQSMSQNYSAAVNRMKHKHFNDERERERDKTSLRELSSHHTHEHTADPSDGAIVVRVD